MTENYKITATIDGSGCRSGINDIKSDLSGLDAHASKVGSAISTALVAGVAAAGVAIGGALVGGTKSFMDYEQSLANVSKTVDGTKEQIAALGEANREVANSTGISVTALNGVSATLGSLGVSYKDIASTTAMVAKGSIALGTDTETLATQIAKISTVYKVPIAQSEQYLSAINALGNGSAATEKEILNYAQEMGPLASMFNIPIEKTAAFGASLISAGIPVSEAATSIRSALEYAMNGADLKMDEATKAQIAAGADQIKAQYKNAGKSAEEASAAVKEYETAQKKAWSSANEGSNERLLNWAKLLGTDVKSLNKMLNEDFQGTMDKSALALGKITDSTKKSKTAFDIWGSYGFKAMGTLSAAAGTYDKNLKIVYADIASGSKSTTAEFDRQNNTLQGSWNKVLTNINDIGITIGQVTSGPVKRLFDAFIAGVPKIKEFTSALLSGDWQKVTEMMASAFQSGVEQAKSLLSELGNSIMAQPWAQWFAKAGDAIISLPWGSWASQAIGLLAAGMQAAISGVLMIGGWIHDKLTGWISSDGPRRLGRDIANAISDAISSWFDSDKSIWESLSDAWGTITEWAKIGWQIVSGIGQGLLDRMYAAVQPSANRLLASFATASYEIQGTFAKAWNTILIGAANLVSGIYSAFSEIGTKIAGYLQPIVDKLNEAYSVAKNAMSLGASSPSQIVSYHDERTGADIAASDVDAYRQQNPTAVLSANTKTKTASGSYTSGGLIANSASITPSASNWQWAGYQTGGSGFVSSELQSAGDGKLYMITDKGDFVTLTGKETVAASIFDLIAPYTADYVTNAAEAGQAWADKVMPVASEIKSSSGEAATTTKEAAKEAAITSKTSAAEQDASLRSFVEWAKAKIAEGATSASSEIAAGGASAQIALSSAAQNALAIGNQVSSNFLNAGNAVKIGMDESGRQIAVIGTVAQQQFTAAGGQWLTSTTNAANANASIGLNAENQKSAISLSAATSTASTFSTSASGLSGAADKVSASAIELGNSGSTVAGSLAATALVFRQIAPYAGGGSNVQGFVNSLKGMGYSGGGNIGSATQSFNDCFFEGFTDSCTNMNINALKYTAPNGTISYVNPMDNASVRALGGGSSVSYSGSGYSSGGSSNYQLPAYLMAKGANPSSPTLAIISDRGEEMVLPHDITVGLKEIIATGGIGRQSIQLPNIEPADIVLDGRKIGEVAFKYGTKGIQGKGDFSFR